ncbi:glycosyltransferase family 8 protein [Vibrio cyclitrophicus]
MNDSETIHISLCADMNFLKPLEICVYSILDNSPDVKICFHIIKLSDFKEDNLLTLVEDTGNSINFYNLELDHREKGRFTKAIYGRLYIDKLVSNDIDKIIYLDCDIVVLSNIKNLWETQIKGYSIGAVPELESHIKKSLMSRFGLDNYFNSGVLVLNLENIRKSCNFSKSIAFLENNKLDYPDQDALNIIFKGDWFELDSMFNFMSSTFTEQADIIHFALAKPWSAEVSNENSYYYYFYEQNYPYRLPFFRLNYTKTKVSFLTRYISRVYWKLKSFRGILL